MKRFGYHPEQLYFNWRNPRKVEYIRHRTHGSFEIPTN